MHGADVRNPFIEWTARAIPDPVLRLRFLRAAAPAWRPEPLPPPPPKRGPWRSLALAAALLLAALALPYDRPSACRRAEGAVLPRPAPVPTPAASPPESPSAVWQVETTPEFETYSNGLRIENSYATANHPRSYLAFPLDGPDAAPGEPRSAPAGIVFHTTESLQEPFEPDRNRALISAGEALLQYVRRKRAYNFVIDRFGRVFRVVREQDAAQHAGYSVWADSQLVYVNLNESFIGVAVETRTAAGGTASNATAAQVRAVAMLAEMLRARFRIPAEDCVTHAQVSVNPARMLAGYHMDWASSFPFEAAGLPDNYTRPLPAVARFGFDYDASFARLAGPKLAAGADLGARELALRAAAAGMSAAAYRKSRQRLFRERLAASRGAAEIHESF